MTNDTDHHLYTLPKFYQYTWIARTSNKSILREINPEYSLEELMLKLKFQYSGHLMWTANSLEKALMLGKTEGRRKRGWQRMWWLDGITDSMDMNLGELWGTVRNKEAGVMQSMGSQRVRHNLVTEQQHLLIIDLGQFQEMGLLA